MISAAAHARSQEADLCRSRNEILTHSTLLSNSVAIEIVHDARQLKLTDSNCQPSKSEFNSTRSAKTSDAESRGVKIYYEHRSINDQKEKVRPVFVFNRRGMTLKQDAPAFGNLLMHLGALEK